LPRAVALAMTCSREFSPRITEALLPCRQGAVSGRQSLCGRREGYFTNPGNRSDPNPERTDRREPPLREQLILASLDQLTGTEVGANQGTCVGPSSDQKEGASVFRKGSTKVCPASVDRVDRWVVWAYNAPCSFVSQRLQREGGRNGNSVSN
jgi:hypothetical protein